MTNHTLKLYKWKKKGKNKVKNIPKSVYIPFSKLEITSFDERSRLIINLLFAITKRVKQVNKET